MRLTISGNETWKKRGFTSLFSAIKSHWMVSRTGMTEYEDQKLEHEKTCPIKYEGSTEKMEVDALKETFMRSQERYRGYLLKLH